MKQSLYTVIAAVAVVALGGAAYVSVPGLESPRRKVDTLADRGAESARRALDLYTDGLARENAVVSRRVVTDFSRLNELIENDNRPATEALEAEAERVNTLMDSTRAAIRELEDRYSSLGGSGQAYDPGRVRFGGNVSAMTQAMTEGVQRMETLSAENRRLLTAASNRVNEAINEQVGEASGADSLAANRLKGVVLYEQGQVAQREALPLQSAAHAVLYDLAGVGFKLSALEEEARVVAASGIVDEISRADSGIRETETRHKELSDEVTELESRIADLMQQIEQQNAVAEEARTRMDEMESRGLNYGDPAAVETFQREYEALALRHRTAVREALALQHGTLANARIDESGDLLRGEFVPERNGGSIEYVLGLDEYERRRRAAESQRGAVADLLNEQKAQLDRFQQTRSRLEAQAAAAQERYDTLAGQARDLWSKFAELRDQVAAKEDQAVKLFKNAATAFAAASRIATARRTDVPPDVDEFSAGSLRSRDDAMAAHADCQAADANLQAALVLYDRYQLLSRASEVLGEVGAVAATQPSADTLAASASEAKEQGRDLLDKSITTLERSSGKLNRHWTVAATVAAADYALFLFGEESLRDLAIANYQSAIEGREQQDLVRPYVERLRQLRDR